MGNTMTKNTIGHYIDIDSPEGEKKNLFKNVRNYYGNMVTKHKSIQVSEHNKLYRQMMVGILCVLSLCTTILSFCARFSDEETKPELLVSFLIVSCLYSILQFLLFVSMVKCAEKYEPAIGLLFSAMVFTILSIILAGISKYRIDNELEEEITTNFTIAFSCLSLFFSFICAILVIKN